MAGFHYIGTPEMVEKVVNGPHKEIPLVDVSGNYPFFYHPQLTGRRIL